MTRAKQEFYCFLIFAIGVVLFGLFSLRLQAKRLEILRRPIEGGSCIERAWELSQPIDHRRGAHHAK